MGAFALFAGLVLAVAGISILTLGVSFNYFVALFHKTPVQPGAVWPPILPGARAPLWLDGIWRPCALGVVVALVSLCLALNGWTLTRLWLYYLASACLTLIGIQLVVAWVQMQVLDTLRIRDELAAMIYAARSHGAAGTHPVDDHPDR